MLRHVILPVEPSGEWRPSVEWLRPLLRRQGTEVVLVGAVQPPFGTGLTASDVGDQIREEAAGYFRLIESALRDEGFSVRHVVRAGAPDAVITDEARARPESMIAMPTHARRGLARLALGSVAESVIRTATVPVLLLRFPSDPALPPPRPVTFQKVLVALDGGELALGMAPWVAELARAFGSSVTLIHVLPARPALAADLETSDRVFAAGRARFKSAGIEVETLLTSGDPAEEVTEACRDRGFDLVACTTHGRTGVARWVLGSVAEEIVRASGVPVLVARG